MTRKQLPDVLDEPEDRKRIWRAVQAECGFSVFYVDRQIIWNAIAHELAEQIRNRDYDPGAVEPVHLTVQADADRIDPKAHR